MYSSSTYALQPNETIRKNSFFYARNKTYDKKEGGGGGGGEVSIVSYKDCKNISFFSPPERKFPGGGEINFRKKRESEREEEWKRDRTALDGSQVHRFTRHEPGFPGRGEKQGGKKRWQKLAGCRSASSVPHIPRFVWSRARVQTKIGRETVRLWEWRKWHHGSIEHGGPARCWPRPFLFRAPASPPARKSERCVMFHLRETPRRFLAIAQLY